jgi:hypothetical protein
VAVRASAGSSQYQFDDLALLQNDAIDKKTLRSRDRQCLFVSSACSAGIQAEKLQESLRRGARPILFQSPTAPCGADLLNNSRIARE